MISHHSMIEYQSHQHKVLVAFFVFSFQVRLNLMKRAVPTNLFKTVLLSSFILVLSLKAHSQEMESETIKPCMPSAHKSVTSTITKIIDYQTVKLDNTQIIRLSGLYFPQITSAKIPQKAQSRLLTMRHNYLKHIALGQTVFYQKSSPQNRYGHLLTSLFLQNKMKSLQYLLIKKGHALFYSLLTTNPCLSLWRRAEKRAQTEKIGIWGHRNSLKLNAKPVKKLNWQTQKFHIITGRIHAIGQSKKRIYLNFEKNWRKDFTITIAKKDRANLQKAGLDIENLTGKIVQIRGWLEWRNGPTMALTHADNLAVLEPSLP